MRDTRGAVSGKFLVVSASMRDGKPRLSVQ
jgi:hypothetical protein